MVDKVGLVLFGSLTLTTLGLGTWQTRRYLDARERMGRAASDVEVGAGNRVDGVDPAGVRMERAVLVGPRTSPAEDTLVKVKGYYVYAPVAVKGEDVLACVGWTDEANALKFVRERGLAFPKPLSMVLRDEAERGNAFSPRNPVGTKQLLWASKEDMMREAGLPPTARLADVLNPPSPPFTPRPLANQGWLKPETHLGYAATWFTLAVAGTFMTRRLVMRNAPR